MLRDYKQMIREIFQGRDPGGVVWQPRIEFWYAVNKKRGTLPAPLENATLLDVYDYCHASVRYFNFPLRQRLHNVEVVETWEEEKSLRRNWNTPVGSLTEVVHYDDYGISRYNTEYLLKTADDFRIYMYVLENEEWWWDQAAYDENVRCIGSRGLTQFWSRRWPIQSLFIESMGFENTILFMVDHPDVIDRYIEVHTRADDAMYVEKFFSMGFLRYTFSPVTHWKNCASAQSKWCVGFIPA
jgi:hypothetical protein